ncbi:unnamed protein product [Closterium sp. NIES-53]
MVDRLPALRRGATTALQKGDLPTQQVDGVPTLQQSGCPALPVEDSSAHAHRTREAGYAVDLDNPRWVDHQVSLVDHRVPLVNHQVRLVDHSSHRATPWSTDPFCRPELSACCRRAPLVDRCSLVRSTDCSVDLPVELPLLVDGPPVAQTSHLQLSSSLVDNNTTAVPCSSTKPVEQLSHCGWSAATPVHPTKSSALPKRGRGQQSIPVNSRDVRFVGGMMYGSWEKQPEARVSQQMEQITMQLHLTPSVWKEGEEAAAEGGGQKVQEAPAGGGGGVEASGSTSGAAGP